MHSPDAGAVEQAPLPLQQFNDVYLRVISGVTISVYKPVALCSGVQSMFVERSCKNYTSGIFGVPFSKGNAPPLVALHSLTRH